MTRISASILALALALVACGADDDAAAPSPSPTEPTASPAQTETPPVSPSPTQPAFDPDAVRIDLEEVADRFQAPLFVTHAGDGSGRIYVVQQPGLIDVMDRDGGNRSRFLNISGRVLSGGERGLLGLTFHPDDPDRLFVNYTDRNGDTNVSEFRRRGNRADPDSERRLLRIDQPFANHNGGMIEFGPDGYLYIATGDGGSGGDPGNRAQSLSTLLGKILRIDVDGDRPYGIPDDNPFVDDDDARDEIWAYGLRNPWRFSFDRETGAMFIADAGQERLEEVNYQPPGEGGLNYGWRIMEGNRCFRPRDCDREGLVLPVTVYPTSRGCVITGGYVYRGERYPALRGGYLFADFCAGTIWGFAARAARDGEVDHQRMRRTDLSISSFGEDEQGEMYVTDLRGGGIYRITARER